MRSFVNPRNYASSALRAALFTMNMRVLELFPHACHSRDKQHSVPDHDKSIPAGGEITMNTINRNYSHVWSVPAEQ
ncbi:hypothetical protein KDX38_20025 [Pseudomonas sp. CDFA 602]|uniref:hypothetical protein n=1 Tax=Pseudomonas californiensis TaxID=2829823 RepID=UPI003872D96F|nr:hypothetical protein [Pseudomonas californiensis]MCD6001492.1 hypothetical protein [Pseudomonas californiensis]